MLIRPDHKQLQYSGRIDFDNPEAPVFVYPSTYVKMKFTSDTLKLVVENHRDCWDNYLGYILDGVQGRLLLPTSGKVEIEIPIPTKSVSHEVLVFKRQDSCHIVTFYGFKIDDDGCLYRVGKKPERRIEVYGDSVSAGEVSEAVMYVGKTDPQHNGEYSNSWYSYSWMTARKLNAELHNVSQGGIALLDKTGWFGQPEYIGVENTYDKIEYNPALSELKPWDFSLYRPHVVIVAIGQNDSHPVDYMAEDPEGEQAQNWKEHYKSFLETLREKYPEAVIIAATTILCHDSSWDDAIEEVCQSIGDSNLHHFLYTRNGWGTPGHIRIPEADEMSDELSAYIESLGEGIWEDEPVKEVVKEA
ncbi:MAG: GDSL-type esterase/lipase family protein [bacterium]|nr:GDSL-type esterase/lipase family protein [bacterium]